MNFSQYANLDDMKVMAGGSPDKMAQYSTAKQEFEQLKTAHFNDDFPFVNSFDESHLAKLKQYAEENPEDESALVRYALQKERFSVQEKAKTASQDRNIALSELKQKLAAGEELTKKDLQNAHIVAKHNPSPDNLVLYSAIKQKINEGADE